MIQLDKLELRQHMQAKLKSISSVEKKKIEQKLFEHLISSHLWKAANVIGVTISQPSEWNTKPIIDAGWKEGKMIVVPKCIPTDKKLHFYQFKSYDQLEMVYFNLLEPKPHLTKKMSKEVIDLLIVPGLLFDKNGFRIGFGGGYFDRFLVNFPNKSLALLSKMQLVNQLPVESHDISIQHLITEEGLIK